MKSSVLLRNFINITYYSMAILWFIILGILIYSIIVNEATALQLFEDSDQFKVSSKPALITILIYSLTSSAFWIYLFRLIRNLMDSLTSRSIFTNFQISSLKLIGQLLIILTVVDNFFGYIFGLIFRDRLRISFDFGEFWLIIALGLFLIFLSQIFEKARSFKEENELTV
jgi:hypothetical protein